MATHPTTWHDLPAVIRASIIAKVAGSEPLKTGNLRHMAVSREWLSATCQGVRSLHLQPSTHVWWRSIDLPRHLRLAAADACRSLLSRFANLESLTFEWDYAGAIKRTTAASCPKLRVLRLGTCDNAVTEADLLAVLQGCEQLRELHCHVGYHNLLEFRVPKEIGNLTALTSLKLSCRSFHPVTLPDTITRLASLQELHLDDMKFSIHPACYSADSPLRSLTLRCPSLEGLPDSFTTLQRLESLSLITRSFTRLPDLSSFSSLICLDLDGCRNVDVRPLFSDLPWLKVLRLKCSDLQDVPAEIGRYTSLEVLHIHVFDNITSLPEQLGQLGSLSELRLDSCHRLSSLPESFGQLQSLQQLVLQCLPRLQALPETLLQLTQLIGLNISGCKKLGSLPDSFGSMCQLRTLTLEGLDLVDQPESSGQLSSLTYLLIDDCPKRAPNLAALGSLRELKLLSIWSWNMEHLPDSLCYLTNLTCFELKSCLKVRSLPDSIGQLQSLQWLEVFCPELRVLPDSLCDLSALTTLVLTCGIAALPHRVSQLPAVKELIVESHRLAALPSDLGSLRELEFFSFSSSILKALPDSLGQLTNLITLCLEECNQLRCLPDSFTQLVCLKKLILSGCSILKTLPLEDGEQPGGCWCLEVKKCPLLELPDSYRHRVYDWSEEFRV